MFRDRSLLNGIGIGLFVGAILLALMDAAAGMEAKFATGQAAAGTVLPDADKLKEQAAKLGYQLHTQAELDAIVKDKLSAEMEKWAAQQAEAKNSDADHLPPAQKIAVFLSGGLNASEIAYAFYRSGVIAEQEPWIRELQTRRLTGKVRAGYYEFDGPQTIEQLIERITTAP